MKAVYMLVGSKRMSAEIEALVRSLPTGEPMLLRREPDNKFDPRAVQVWARGICVGYIPMKDNAKISARLDAMGAGAEIAGKFSPRSARWIEVDE